MKNQIYRRLRFLRFWFGRRFYEQVRSEAEKKRKEWKKSLKCNPELRERWKDSLRASVYSTNGGPHYETRHERCDES